MRLLFVPSILSFTLVHLVSAQGSVETQPITNQPTTTKPFSAQDLVIQSAPFPTATGPQCLEPRGQNDPSASDIAQAFHDDNTVSKACNVKTQTTTTIGQLIVISYGLGNYFFNISHYKNVVSAPIVSPNLCPNTFNAILQQCVTGTGSFWGGYDQGGIANYSSTSDNPRKQVVLRG